MRSVAQSVVLGGGIEIFLVWLVGCAPIFRVELLTVRVEEAWEASLAFVVSAEVDPELSVSAGPVTLTVPLSSPLAYAAPAEVREGLLPISFCG